MGNMKMRISLNIALGIAICTAFSGCRTADDQIKQDAVIQGNEGANAGSRVQKERESEMENDLSVRQRIYQSVVGTYSGTERVTGNMKVTYTLKVSATVQPYRGSRVRTETEIATDLARLALRAELKGDAGAGAQYACLFSSVPFEEQIGEFALGAPNCMISAEIRIGDKVTLGIPSDSDSISARLAEQILDGKLNSIPVLYFSAVSTMNGRTFSSVLRKISGRH
jgi:hypothetical protein